MEWSGAGRGDWSCGWWVCGGGGGWVGGCEGVCVVWWVGGRRSGWVAGWVGEGCECVEVASIFVPEGAKNKAKLSQKGAAC